MFYMYCTSSETNAGIFLNFIRQNHLSYTVERNNGTVRFGVKCEGFDDYDACCEQGEMMPNDWVIF